jgi:hypothetical protein
MRLPEEPVHNIRLQPLQTASIHPLQRPSLIQTDNFQNLPLSLPKRPFNDSLSVAGIRHEERPDRPPLRLRVPLADPHDPQNHPGHLRKVHEAKRRTDTVEFEELLGGEVQVVGDAG